MVGIIDSFRSGVPSSKQLYSKYSSDGITYKKFKKQFCDIIEIKKYILSMNNEDYLAKKEVHNIFKYLNNSFLFVIRHLLPILSNLSKMIASFS